MKNIQNAVRHYAQTWGGITLIALILLSAPIFLSDFRLTLLGKFMLHRWGWGYHRQFDSLQRRYQSGVEPAGRKG